MLDGMKKLLWEFIPVYSHIFEMNLMIILVVLAFSFVQMPWMSIWDLREISLRNITRQFSDGP
jgi:hypothetical protein